MDKLIVRIPDRTVDPKRPYEADLLGRQEFGAKLTKFLTESTSGFNLAIDGDWGSGKTFFAKMWKADLESAGFRVVYFDAFQSDYEDEPFVPLTACIIERLENWSADEDAIQELKETAWKISRKVLSTTVRFGLRAAAASVTAGASELAINAGQDLAKDGEEAFDRLLDQFQVAPDTRDKFQNVLATAAADSSEQGRLVVVIDELDRCRPDFAVRTLERIKHFFSIDEIYFVFVINSTQVYSALRRLYGGEIDAGRYLDKFIHAHFRLPSTIGGHGQVTVQSTYVRHVWASHDSLNGITDSFLEDLISGLAEAYELSLRDIEAVIRSLALLYASFHRTFFDPITGLLLVLRVADKMTYSHLASGLEPPDERWFEKISGTHALDYARECAEIALGRHEGREDVKKELQRYNFRNAIEPRELFQHHARRIDSCI